MGRMREDRKDVLLCGTEVGQGPVGQRTQGRACSEAGRLRVEFNVMRDI